MNRNFTVIHGTGAMQSANRDNLKFVSAYVTDTRLMGVVVLSITWKRKSTNSTFNQFFYFDAEEFGLENYNSISGDDPLQLLTLENTLIGGLGSKKNFISEEEARFLVHHFSTYNEKFEKPLPDNKNEFDFLLEPVDLDLSTFSMMKKMSKPIESIYEQINYFLMRSFARDTLAVEYLSGGRPLAPYLGKPATLHKNSIHEMEDANGISYVCESLIEASQGFSIIVTEIILKEYHYEWQILGARTTSTLHITQTEAALMLMRSEFVTVYEVLNLEDFFPAFLNYALSFAKTPYEMGTLFIQFNPDNSHVKSKNFRLNHDVAGLYYLTELGQLIVAAYEETTIKKLEDRLAGKNLSPYLMLEDRFEFKSPIVYEFILSEFEDFFEFVIATEE